MLSRELRRIGIAISHHSLQKRSRVEILMKVLCFLKTIHDEEGGREVAKRKKKGLNRRKLY